MDTESNKKYETVNFALNIHILTEAYFRYISQHLNKRNVTEKKSCLPILKIIQHLSYDALIYPTFKAVFLNKVFPSYKKRIKSFIMIIFGY